MPDWKKMSGFAIALARVMVHVSQGEKERREGGKKKAKQDSFTKRRDEAKRANSASAGRSRQSPPPGNTDESGFRQSGLVLLLPAGSRLFPDQLREMTKS